MKKEEIKKALEEHYREVGRKGGRKTAARGSSYFREIQQKSVESRRRNQEAKLLHDSK